MKQLIYTRLIISLVIGIACGMGAEATTASEAKYIIKDFPGFLSIIFFASAIFQACQFLLSKLKTNLAIWLPLSFEIILLPTTFILFYIHQYFYMITVAVLAEAIAGIFYMNRSNIITDKIKNLTNMKHFFNLKASLFAGGQLGGYFISYLLINYLKMEYIHIYLLSIIIWTPTISILLYENLILNKEK